MEVAVLQLHYAFAKAYLDVRQNGLAGAQELTLVSGTIICFRSDRLRVAFNIINYSVFSN